MGYFSDTEYATLRRDMRHLPRRRFLMIYGVELQPHQLRELDALRNFVLIAGRENQDEQKKFYCVAHREDKHFAIAQITSALEKIGATNISDSEMS